MHYEAQLIMAGLAIADFITTNYAVRRHGPEVELNPLWRRGFIKGSVQFDILYFAGVFLMIGLSVWAKESWFVVALIAALSAPVANNLFVLFRSRKK